MKLCFRLLYELVVEFNVKFTIFVKTMSFDTTLKSSAVLLLEFSQKAAPLLLVHQGPAAPRNRQVEGEVLQEDLGSLRIRQVPNGCQAPPHCGGGV